MPSIKPTVTFADQLGQSAILSTLNYPIHSDKRVLTLGAPVNQYLVYLDSWDIVVLLPALTDFVRDPNNKVFRHNFRCIGGVAFYEANDGLLTWGLVENNSSTKAENRAVFSPEQVVEIIALMRRYLDGDDLEYEGGHSYHPEGGLDYNWNARRIVKAGKTDQRFDGGTP